MRDSSGYKHDVYASYGFTYIDWTTPHYAASSWVYHLEWVKGWR